MGKEDGEHRVRELFRQPVGLEWKGVSGPRGRHPAGEFIKLVHGVNITRFWPTGRPARCPAAWCGTVSVVTS